MNSGFSFTHQTSFDRVMHVLIDNRKPFACSQASHLFNVVASLFLRKLAILASWIVNLGNKLVISLQLLC